MAAINHKPLIDSITTSIANALSNRNRKSEFHPCLGCGKPTKRPFWCDDSCGRKAHYLRFSVRKIIKNEVKAKAVA